MAYKKLEIDKYTQISLIESLIKKINKKILYLKKLSPKRDISFQRYESIIKKMTPEDSNLKESLKKRKKKDYNLLLNDVLFNQNHLSLLIDFDLFLKTEISLYQIEIYRNSKFQKLLNLFRGF